MKTPVSPTNFHNQQRLLEVCKNFSANLEFEPLLAAIIETASELTSSEWSLILTQDLEAKTLRVSAAPFYLRESLEKAQINLQDSIAGEVITSGELMLYDATQQKGEQAKTALWEVEQKARLVAAVPICYRGETVGVLEAFNKNKEAAYSSQDIECLQVLASQAAGAIQNQRLIQQSENSIQQMVELDHMKNDFIAIASHELRTPLGLIMGHTSFINETATDVQKQDIEVITRSATRMKDLIDEFGDMDTFAAGIKKLKSERVLFDPLVKGLVATFQAEARERKVRLVHEIKQHNLAAECDSEKITLVLRNLIKNALNFTNAGGVVKVTAEEVPGYVKLTVIDSGIGIPAAEQKKIFKRFYQVEKHLTRRHGGMGLGLSSAKEMVEMHGGKIWVESVEEKGSRFTVLIPLNAAQASAAQKVFLE
jgi:signal transduction histidine kinase